MECLSSAGTLGVAGDTSWGLQAQNAAFEVVAERPGKMAAF